MIILAGLCTLVGGVLFSIQVIKKRARFWQVSSYLFFLLGILALSPINNLLPAYVAAPTQIVYRFDEDRYIQLTGYRCQGRAYFIDEKEKVYYELSPHFWEVFAEPYSHPAKNYLSIPLDDLSAVDTSIDGGRTFKSSHFPVGSYLKNKVQQYTVVNDQAFILTKEGQLYVSENPFGSKTYWLVSKEDRRPNAVVGPSKIIPDTIPPIPADYTGWDKMRCNYSAPGVDLPRARSALQIYQEFLGININKGIL